MNHLRRYIAPIILVASLVLLAGCGSRSSGEPLPPGPPAPSAPEDRDDFIFYYDFADVDLGDAPAEEGWIVGNAADGERGDVKVAADSEIDSGRALHVVANQWTGDGASVTVRFPKWDIPSEDVETIAYEYKLKHVEGGAGTYVYVNETGSDHRIILRPLNEDLVWHASFDGLSPTTLGPLKSGWNTIRVIANKTTRSGDVYINNMETPVARSLTFQRVVDSWDQLMFVITHETNANEAREAYYADFKVWAVD